MSLVLTLWNGTTSQKHQSKKRLTYLSLELLIACSSLSGVGIREFSLIHAGMSMGVIFFRSCWGSRTMEISWV